MGRPVYAVTLPDGRRFEKLTKVKQSGTGGTATIIDFVNPGEALVVILTEDDTSFIASAKLSNLHPVEEEEPVEHDQGEYQDE